MIATADAPTASSWRIDLRAALPGWLVARVVVLAAWAANALLVELRFDGVAPTATDQGLFAWDGSYYRAIAELGYAGAQADGIRFHPLVPLLAVNGLGVLLLANVSALFAGAAVHRLVVAVLGDHDLARRSATLVALAPPAFVLVWAYAEGPFLVLAACQLLALHRRRWWLAAVLGALATLTRPAGLMLALPAAVEVARGLRAAPVREIVGRVAAVLGPVVAMAGFLLWVERATGDWGAPLRIQEDYRGGFAFLPFRLVEGMGEVVSDPFGDGLHVPFAFAMVWLAWVCWKRFPVSWMALAVVSVIQNVGAGNLNSIERYAYGTVPILVAFAAVTGGRWWRPAIVTSTVLMAAMAVVAWQGDFVP